MNPYKINPQALEDFKSYHKIKTNEEVAKQLGISGAYLSMLLSNRRGLNEWIRARFQLLTRLSQDQLFFLDPNVNPFSHQSQAYAKFYGVVPYSKFSTAWNALEEREIPKPDPGGNGGNGNNWFKRKFWRLS